MPDGAAWSLDNRLTVVLFAGLGGACDGLEAAGFPVHVAVNHDPVAVAAHAARHPHTRHLRGDVWEVDPLEATGGRPVRLLHASPDCTHFSRAKGRAPVSKAVRSLPWVVCRWAARARPETILMENVPELEGWGPLVARRKVGHVLRLDGSAAAPGERVVVQDQQLMPDRRRAGVTFRRFVAHLRRLGYAVEWRPLVAADYGVPTIRRRFFMVAQRDGGPILWPARTHAPRAKAPALGLASWRPAADVVDWLARGNPVHGRPRPLAAATMRGIERGIQRYGEAGAFIRSYYSQGKQDQAIADPLGTVTTKARHALIIVPPDGPATMRMLSPEECAAAQGFKPGALPEVVEIDGQRRRLTKTERYALVGNSVPPRWAELLARLNVRRELSMEAAE